LNSTTDGFLASLGMTKFEVPRKLLGRWRFSVARRSAGCPI
jgi:hypothetical protein